MSATASTEGNDHASDRSELTDSSHHRFRLILMRRRLTISILAIVAATLVFAGVGTLLLGRIGARAATEKDLRAQAEGTAGLLEYHGKLATSDPTTGRRVLPRERLAQLQRSLKVEAFDVVVLTKDDEVTELGDQLPPGVTVDMIDPDALRSGETVSGSVGGTKVFAASAIPVGSQSLAVLVLTRPVDPLFGRSVRWFLIAAGVTLVLGAVVAFRLSRRLTKPLREATVATARISAGDLSTRLPSHPGAAHRDELDELGGSINAMAEALERSRGLERQFLLSVSHDLRTPLTSIRGYAEAIADGATPDHKAAAATILAESRRLERLVRDLLELAKLDAREFSLAIGPVDLAAVATDAVAGFHHQSAAAGLHIEVVAPAEPVVVAADQDRLGQVIANLVENALRYASSNITVRVTADPHLPLIEVADDGPGIAAEDRPHVFERLYQASARPQRKETGSGLGLAITHELVVAMGGTITVGDEAGGGTRMVVTLRAFSA